MKNSFQSAWYLLLAVFSCSLSFADWTLIEDFEGFEAGILYPSPWPVARNPGPGEVQVFAGTPGGGGDKAAWFWIGLTVNQGDAWHQLAFPEEIPINGKGTIFFRIWQAVPEIGYLVSFSKTAAGEAPDDTALWNTLSGVLRHSSLSDHPLDAHDGGYVLSNPAFTPAPETWVSYWMVINNRYNAVGEQPSGVGGYTVYRQGPDDAAPVLMTFGDENPKAFLAMRNQDYAPVRTLVLVGQSPFPFAPEGYWLIDDIYFTAGACLSDPRATGDACEIWCEYVVVDDWCFVDDGIGHLFVGNAPWVYSLKLDTWFFLTGCPGDDGFWSFVLKGD